MVFVVTISLGCCVFQLSVFNTGRGREVVGMSLSNLINSSGRNSPFTDIPRAEISLQCTCKVCGLPRSSSSLLRHIQPLMKSPIKA